MIDGTEYTILDGVPFSSWDGPKGVKLMIANTMYEWKALHAMMMKQPLVACDTETTGLRWYKEGIHIIGMSFGWGLHHFYVPVRHVASRTHPHVLPQLSMDDLREDLQKFFAREDLTTVWANAKFDWHMYENDGIDASKGVYHDVLTAWKFYDENAPGSLKDISTGWRDNMGNYIPGVVGKDANMFEKEIRDWRVTECARIKQDYRDMLKEITNALEKDPQYQGVKRNELKKIAAKSPLLSAEDRDKKLTDVHYGLVPIDMMARYAAMDTFLTWQVYQFVMQNVNFDKKKLKLYVNEHKLSRVLFSAERRGVHLDLEKLKTAEPVYEEAIATKEQALRSLIPEEFADINLASNDQLAVVLKACGLPLDKVTKTGKTVVDRKVLNKLLYSPVVAALLDLRQTVKVTNTYISGLQNFVSNGLVHGSFNQNMKTGRMSCQAPSLLNIPKKDDTIRASFTCPPDHYFVIPDFSQIEVRLLANESQDPLLLDTYAKGQDVHTRTMCEVFGHNIDEVTGILEDEAHPQHKELSLLRSATKTIVFGIIYGISSFGLAEQIKRPSRYAHLDLKSWQAVCEEYIRAYFDKYLYVKRFINRTNREVHEDGFVTNSYGRVRHLPYANALKLAKGEVSEERYKFLRSLQSRAERQAVNFKIQGMAADMFKEVVIRVHNRLQGTRSHLVNMIHDEIWFYVHKEDANVIPLLKHDMEDFNMRVPIVAEFTYSTTSWANKIKGFPPGVS